MVLWLSNLDNARPDEHRHVLLRTSRRNLLLFGHPALNQRDVLHVRLLLLWQLHLRHRSLHGTWHAC